MNHSIKHNKKEIFVLRHGHRSKAADGSFGHDLALTLEGKNAARNWGAQSKILWREVHTSPLLRCVETADEILKGAGQQLPLITSTILGDPGPFIENPDLAGTYFLEHSLLKIIQILVEGKMVFPGMRSLAEGGEIFLQYILKVKSFPCLMITHDIVICLLCCYFLQSKEIQKYLPAFLEGFSLDINSTNIIWVNNSLFKKNFSR